MDGATISEIGLEVIETVDEDAVKFAVTLKGPDNVIVCGFCVAEGATVKLVKAYPLLGAAVMVTAPLETQPVPGEMVPPAAGLAEVVS